MRVAIAGAGAVGRSIAGELLENGHEVLLIDKAPTAISVERVPQAEWLLADACEITSLDEAALERCNVVIAATGDDKVNLVVSLLAKTEYGVPRVVSRVNNPKNEWLFNESWGVDVAVSTPRLMSALVEEAVSVGDLVRLLRFSQGDANLVELTLPPEAALAGTRVGDVRWPEDTALVTIIRGNRVLVPDRDDALEVGDELLFVAAPAREAQLEDLLSVRGWGPEGARPSADGARVRDRRPRPRGVPAPAHHWSAAVTAAGPCATRAGARRPRARFLP
jgi:trk system potassium uptake protein